MSSAVAFRGQKKHIKPPAINIIWKVNSGKTLSNYTLFISDGPFNLKRGYVFFPKK